MILTKILHEWLKSDPDAAIKAANGIKQTAGENEARRAAAILGNQNTKAAAAGRIGDAGAIERSRKEAERVLSKKAGKKVKLQPTKASGGRKIPWKKLGYGGLAAAGAAGLGYGAYKLATRKKKRKSED